jgi:hypothetical protein
MIDYTMETARKLGTYQAIAQMMRDSIRRLDAAEDDFDRDWELMSLRSLANQLDAAEEKMKKEVDTVAE